MIGFAFRWGVDGVLAQRAAGLDRPGLVRLQHRHRPEGGHAVRGRLPVSAADTPQRIASLQTLPAHRFVRQVRDGRAFWLYADPTVCKCVYAGTDEAFSAYKQEMFRQRLADENLMAARIAQDAAIEQWELGPWAPWAPFYY